MYSKNLVLSDKECLLRGLSRMGTPSWLVSSLVLEKPPFEWFGHYQRSSIPSSELSIVSIWFCLCWDFHWMKDFCDCFSFLDAFGVLFHHFHYQNSVCFCYCHTPFYVLLLNPPVYSVFFGLAFYTILARTHPIILST